MFSKLQVKHIAKVYNVNILIINKNRTSKNAEEQNIMHWLV